MDKGDDLKVWAGFCYLIAAGLIGFGFYIMFTYGDGSDYSPGGQKGHIVGGDAYNFIIIGVRGLGFIMSGLSVTVVGAASSIYAALVSNHSAQKTESEAHST